MPTDAEWKRISEARALVKNGIGNTTATRLQEYEKAIAQREAWRNSVGMDEHGVTAGMRNYLAHNKQN